MSNRAHLILISGSSSSLATDLAAATVREFPEACDVLTVADIPVHPLLTRAATAGIGALLTGGQALPDEVWGSLPGVTELSLLLAAQDLVAAGDSVVVDGGTLDATQRLVSLPSLTLRILDSVLTPDVAMVRVVAGETPFEALSALRAALHRVVRLLLDPGTVARLVTDVDDEALAAVRAADATLAAQGVSVDGVVIVRRTGEREDADALVTRIEMLGITAWATGRRRRPSPAGENVNNVLSGPRAMRDVELEVTHHGDRFTLAVPVAADRVGIDGEHLVIDVAGSLRWMPLPSALTRCIVMGARRRQGTVEITFAPDSARWRPAS